MVKLMGNPPDPDNHILLDESEVADEIRDCLEAYTRMGGNTILNEYIESTEPNGRTVMLYFENGQKFRLMVEEM